MATFVHARRREGQLFFRVWNTVVDQYETEPMTHERALAYLMGERGEVSDAKRRADAALGAVFGAVSGMGMRVVSRDRDKHSRTEAVERLARAEKNGTSSMLGDRDDLDGEWDTEICSECGSFHHEFEADESDGQCGSCGEPQDDDGHLPVCAPGARVARV